MFTAGEWAVDKSVGYNSEDRKLKSHYQLSIHIINSRDVRISALKSTKLAMKKKEKKIVKTSISTKHKKSVNR